MNFADTFTLLHSPIATVRVEPPDAVIVEGPAIETLRFSRSRLQLCETQLVENGEIAIRLRIDVVARWRGEEFAIVMRSADLDVAREVAGGVLDAVRGLQLVTCSAGVAQARPGETLGEIARRAELAMIEAKRAGRDRLVVAP